MDNTEHRYSILFTQPTFIEISVYARLCATVWLHRHGEGGVSWRQLLLAWSLEPAGNSEVTFCQRREGRSHGSTQTSVMHTCRPSPWHLWEHPTAERAGVQPGAYFSQGGREGSGCQGVKEKLALSQVVSAYRAVPACTELVLLDVKASILWELPLLRGLPRHGRNAMQVCIQKNGDARLWCQKTQAWAQAFG